MVASLPVQGPRRGSKLAAGDRRAIWLFALGPVLLLGLPAIAGFPLITGDDVIQNLPLRLLSAQILLSGHLPVLDPFLSSGAPLLGGVNAGSLSPTVLPFLVLPTIAAFVVVEAGIYTAALLGSYVLLRMRRCAPLAAGAGAVTFALMGEMTSQAVHLGFIFAFAALTWVLVGCEGLAHRSSSEARPLRDRQEIGYVVLVAVATACVGLSGSAEGAIYAAIAAAAFVVALLLASPASARIRLLGTLSLAAVLGIALAAPQWLTGELFLEVSQRAALSFGAFSAGSVSFGELAYLIAPHLLGGGPLGMERFVGSYNMGELDGYVGLLPIGAALVLASRWRAAGASRWRIWLVLAGVGLVLALGRFTPLAHLTHALPVLGDQRLPSRALILLDLGLAMAFGCFLDEQLAPSARRPVPSVARRRVELALLWSGPAAALLAVAGFAGDGSRLAVLVGGRLVGTWQLDRVAPYLVATAMLGCFAGIVAWSLTRRSMQGRRRLGERTSRLVVALVAFELVCFLVNQSSFAPERAEVLGGSTAESAALASLAGSGRVAILDPRQRNAEDLALIGGPDLNILRGIDSVQGYGSLLYGPYARATGTHGQEVASPALLGPRLSSELDLAVVLALPDALLGSSRSRSSPIELSTGRSVTRYFGETLTLSSLDIELSSPMSPAVADRLVDHGLELLSPGATPAASALGPGASIRLTARARTIEVRPAHPVAAGGVVVDNLADRKLVVDKVTVLTAAGRTYALDGPFAAALGAPSFEPVARIGGFTAFAGTSARGPAWLVPSRNGALPVGDIERLNDSADEANATFAVHTSRPALLVRSETDLPGWSVTVATGGIDGGAARPARLQRYGLVQAVAVPSGRSFVTFSYNPPGLATAMTAAGASAMALLLLGLWWLVMLLVSGRQRRARPLPDRSAVPAVVDAHELAAFGSRGAPR
jgi:hypothetical protein